MNDPGKRWPLLVAAAAVLFGAAYMLGRPAKRPGSRRLVVERPAIPENEEPPRATPEPGGSSLYAVPRPMTIGEFLDIVGEEVPAKVADEFILEFNQEPELVRQFEEARASRQFPAAEFLAKIGKHPKMRALLKRFEAKPAFQAAFQSIAEREDIDRLLNQEVRAVEEAARVARGEAPAGAAQPGGRAATASVGVRGPAGFRAAVQQAGSKSAFAGGIGEGTALASGAGAATGALGGRYASGNASGASSTGGGRPSQAAGTPDGSEAHDTGPLEVIDAAGPDQDAIAFYLSLFGRTDPGLRRALETACDGALAQDKGCGIVDLCWSVGMNRCRNACAAAGAACTITFPPDPPPPPPETTSAISVAAADPGGGGSSVVAPHATNYGNGQVYDGGNQVMTYGGEGPKTDGYHTGYVNLGDQVVGTYYTDQTTGSGVVRDANDEIIYTYDNQGGVTTCPCP